MRTFKNLLIPTLISASMAFTKVQSRFNNIPYKNVKDLQSFLALSAFNSYKPTK